MRNFHQIKWIRINAWCMNGIWTFDHLLTFLRLIIRHSFVISFSLRLGSDSILLKILVWISESDDDCNLHTMIFKFFIWNWTQIKIHVLFFDKYAVSETSSGLLTILRQFYLKLNKGVWVVKISFNSCNALLKEKSSSFLAIKDLNTFYVQLT